MYFYFLLICLNPNVIKFLKVIVNYLIQNYKAAHLFVVE